MKSILIPSALCLLLISGCDSASDASGEPDTGSTTRPEDSSRTPDGAVNDDSGMDDSSSSMDAPSDIDPLHDVLSDTHPPEDTPMDIDPPRDVSLDTNLPQDVPLDMDPPDDASADTNPLLDTPLDIDPPQDASPDTSPSHDVPTDVMDTSASQDVFLDTDPPDDASADTNPLLDTPLDIDPPQDVSTDTGSSQDAPSDTDSSQQDVFEDVAMCDPCGANANCNALTGRCECNLGFVGDPTLGCTLMGTDPNGFNIDWQVHPSSIAPNADTVTAIEDAIGVWERAISGDLEDVASIRVDPSSCAVNAAVHIDDLLIRVRVTDEPAPLGDDGEATVIATAGPRCLRANGLPYTGTITIYALEFDHLSAPAKLDIMMHELGHTLGIASLSPGWTSQRTGSATDPDGRRFSGANASREWNMFVNAASGDTPTLSPGGTHWREPGALQWELMSPAYNRPIALGMTANALSTVTLGAMEDIGYEVDYSASEDLSIPLSFRMARFVGDFHDGVIDLSNDAEDGPVYMLTPSGELIEYQTEQTPGAQ